MTQNPKGIQMELDQREIATIKQALVFYIVHEPNEVISDDCRKLANRLRDKRYSK